MRHWFVVVSWLLGPGGAVGQCVVLEGCQGQHRPCCIVCHVLSGVLSVGTGGSWQTEVSWAWLEQALTLQDNAMSTAKVRRCWATLPATPHAVASSSLSAKRVETMQLLRCGTLHYVQLVVYQ